MPPKKASFHSQASSSEPLLPPGGFIRAPRSKAKVLPKARRVRPAQDDPSPSRSLFDLMPPLLVEESPNVRAGPSSQVRRYYWLYRYSTNLYQPLHTPIPAVDESNEPFDFSSMFVFSAPPEDPESEEEEEEEEDQVSLCISEFLKSLQGTILVG